MKIYRIIACISSAFAAFLVCLLFLFYFRAKKNILDAAMNLKAIGNEFIVDTLEVFNSIPVDTEINIENSVPVFLKTMLDDSVKIEMLIKYSHTLNIPINLGIKDVIHVDTSLQLPYSLKLMTEGQVPINQKFTIFEKFNVPVKAIIPLNKLLSAKLEGQNRFISDIPISVRVDTILPYKLDIKIPINQKIKLIFPICQMATVSFPQKVKIKGVIPISLKIPVKIPLSKTPLKKYLDNTANDLSNIFN